MDKIAYKASLERSQNLSDIIDTVLLYHGAKYFKPGPATKMLIIKGIESQIKKIVK